MVDREKTFEQVVYELIRERLKDFDISKDICRGLASDINAASLNPSRNKHGACVMTGEASLAADQERKHGADPSRAKPQVM